MRRLFRLAIKRKLDDKASTCRDAGPTTLIVRWPRTDQNDLTVVLAGGVSGLGQFVSFEHAEATRICSNSVTEDPFRRRNQPSLASGSHPAGKKS